MLTELGATSTNKGYQPQGHATPFPAALCTSVNAQIVHGIPSAYTLKNGDLLNLDIGAKKDGYCGDAAISIGIGEISNQDEWLLKTAKEALQAALGCVKDGAWVRDIGQAAEAAAIRRGFVTNRNFCGHGIGREMHEPPEIINYYKEDYEPRLTAGQQICIEPEVTRKDKRGMPINDWTWVTRDGRNSAFFEAMVEVTKTGYQYLIDPFNL